MRIGPSELKEQHHRDAKYEIPKENSEKAFHNRPHTMCDL
jgi:hypothetical protein